MGPLRGTPSQDEIICTALHPWIAKYSFNIGCLAYTFYVCSKERLLSLFYDTLFILHITTDLNVSDSLRYKLFEDTSKPCVKGLDSFFRCYSICRYIWRYLVDMNDPNIKLIIQTAYINIVINIIIRLCLESLCGMFHVCIKMEFSE